MESGDTGEGDEGFGDFSEACEDEAVQLKGFGVVGIGDKELGALAQGFFGSAGLVETDRLFEDACAGAMADTG